MTAKSWTRPNATPPELSSYETPWKLVVWAPAWAAWESRNERAFSGLLVSSTIAPSAPPVPNGNAPGAPPPSRPCSSSEGMVAEACSEVRNTPA